MFEKHFNTKSNNNAFKAPLNTQGSKKIILICELFNPML